MTLTPWFSFLRQSLHLNWDFCGVWFQRGKWYGNFRLFPDHGESSLRVKDFQATQSSSGLLLCRKHSLGRGTNGACFCIRWSFYSDDRNSFYSLFFDGHNFRLMKSFCTFPEISKVWIQPGCQLSYRLKMSWDWETALNNIVISVNNRSSVSLCFSGPTVHICISPGFTSYYELATLFGHPLSPTQ